LSYIGKTPTPAPLTANDIADGIITEDKLGANAVTTGKITDGTVAQADISDQAINEAKMQVSNSPTNGYFLSAQSGNTGGMTWAEAGGGGKILQVVSVAETTARSTNSTSFNTMSSALTLNITPSATSSKILVMLSTGFYLTANDGSTTIFRDSTNLGHSLYGLFYMHAAAGFGMATINHMDSPSSTSQLTYAMYGRNVSGSSTLTIGNENGTGSLIAMEIGA